MKQKISLFYVAIAFSIAGLCTSCSSDDPVDDTGGGTNNPGGTSSDVKQLMENFLLSHTPKVTVAIPPEDAGEKFIM